MKQELFNHVVGKTIEEFYIEDGNYVLRVEGDEREFVISPKYNISESDTYGECLVLPIRS